MTLDEFENALHKLLDDAVEGGLAPVTVQEVADAVIASLPDAAPTIAKTLGDIERQSE